MGGKVGWFVPTYRNGRPLWRWAEAAVAPLRKAGVVSVNRSERMIEFANGGFLGIYSTDNPDSARGESLHLAVLDEAARIPEEVWTDAIQPTLADFGGDAILISTPKGRNWFWLEWQRGQDGGGDSIASWRAPSRDNPNPRIRQAADLARDRVPDRTYRQEWLAEFVDDGGGVFRNVVRCATARPQERVNGHEYVMGVDWGKVNDATVITVIDMTERRQVHVQRLRKIDYTLQLQTVLHVAALYRPYTIIPERNSVGEPMIEQMVRRGLPVNPFYTSNESKALIIEDLQLAFENKTIEVLDDPVQTGELEAYELLKRTATGQPVYGAPHGLHDDYVMALAFAWSAARVTRPSVEFF